MWIILVNKDLQEIRNNVLTELLNNEKPKESYLNYRYGRFSHSGFLPDAKVYKTKSGAERLISEFKSSNNTTWKSKFHLINEKELSVRKLTREEWHMIIDFELSKLDTSYQRNKSKLMKKKTQFPLS